MIFSGQSKLVGRFVLREASKIPIEPELVILDYASNSSYGGLTT